MIPTGKRTGETLCDAAVVAYLLIFLGGVAGSLHCVGMCGAFPLAVSGGASGRNLTRQVLYNVGRLNALVFIGAVSGAAGDAGAQPLQRARPPGAARPPLPRRRSLLVIAFGAITLLRGLDLLPHAGHLH